MSERDTARMRRLANERIFDAVAKLPEGEALRPRRSLFTSIVHTFNHSYIIDRILQGHLEGRVHGYTARNTLEYPPLAELWQAQRVIDGWYVEWSQRSSASTRTPSPRLFQELGRPALRQATGAARARKPLRARVHRDLRRDQARGPSRSTRYWAR